MFIFTTKSKFYFIENLPIYYVITMIILLTSIPEKSWKDLTETLINE